MKKIYFYGLLFISFLSFNSAKAQYSVNQSGLFNPADISAGSTSVFLGDDQVSGALPIGFSFTFYGNSYSDFYFSSNGFITFSAEQGSGCCSGEFIPSTDFFSPNNLIAFAWSDLYPPGNGFLRYSTIGIAPNRILIVDAVNQPNCCNNVPRVSAQLKLYEGSNVIEMHNTSILANGNLMTQGLENIDGSQGIAVPGRNQSSYAITNDFVSFTPTATGETNVQASQCGVTLPNYNSIVYANLVAGAERYRFRVTNLLTNVVVEKEYVLRNLYMNSLSNFQYNQQYSVEVAVRKAGVWLPYGSSCNITTANATTKVVASQCGTTLTARSNFVYADIVSLASGYRFRVTNLSTSSVQLIDRTLRTFTFNMVTDYQDATAYTVEVAAKNTNGVYLAFGDVCTIFTPGIIIPERQINTKDDGNYNFVATGYPNPFENSFKVSFDSNSLSTVTIVIYDMLGKQVEYREVKSDDLNNIDLGSTLNSGVYNIIVSQDETIHSMRMVKR